MAIRVLIADDQPVVRMGLNAMLLGTEIEVAYQVPDGEQAVQCALVGRPDLVMLDLRMPGTSGLEALAQIKEQCPAIPVLLLSASENIEEIAQGYRLGASGFVSKSLSRATLLQAIRRTVSHGSAWPRSLLRRVRLMTRPSKGSVVGNVWLTGRQQEVLRKVAEGQSNEEIGEELGVSIETVRQHMKEILRKTGSVDRTQAALWAIRFGLG